MNLKKEWFSAVRYTTLSHPERESEGNYSDLGIERKGTDVEMF